MTGGAVSNGTLDTAVAVMAGLANFLVIFAFYRMFAPNDSVNARARAHGRRRRELRTAMLAPARPAKRERSVTTLRRLLERLKLNRGTEVRKAADLLAQAGWRSPDSMTIFQTMRLAAPLGFGVVVYLMAPFLAAHLAPLIRGLAGFCGIGVGAMAPGIFVKNASQKRRQKIQSGLPDALDLFVICAEAGLSLDAAIARVARELGRAAPELADELGLTAIELGFLPNRRDALNNLAKRVDSPSIRGLVTTLAQTERYGTPLAQSLRVLATEFRNNRMMKAEEKAARLPATLTVPMIVFILPPLFVVLIGPAVIQVMAAFPK